MIVKRDLKDILKIKFSKIIRLIIVEKVKFPILIVRGIIRVTALIIIISKEKS